MQRTHEETIIHTEKPASGEIGDQARMAQEQQHGILESIKDGVMAGVETVRDGVNYLAERVTGSMDATTTTPAGTHTETTTTIERGPNPEVEKRSKIVEHQTTYPNQQGFGVNPKFKDDVDSGALADIKSGIKKGVENIKEGAKEFKEDVEEGARELKNNVKEGWEDVKIEANRVSNNPPPVGPHGHAREARRLEAKADDIFDDTEKDFDKARHAQAKANKEAAKANAQTAKAMNKQELGQEYLAQAGAEMHHAEIQHQAYSKPTTKTVTETHIERHVR